MTNDALRTLLPIAGFMMRNPGALSARFSGISYLSANTSVISTVGTFIKQYAIDVTTVRTYLIF